MGAATEITREEASDFMSGEKFTEWTIRLTESDALQWEQPRLTQFFEGLELISVAVAGLEDEKGAEDG